MTTESDPKGLNPSDPGAKLDQGKNRLGLVMFGFAGALEQVGKVGTYGAGKYSDNGWMQVDDGERRYTDAMFRHLMKEAQGEDVDIDTGLLHAAHTAWNALARLDLIIKERAGSCRQKPPKPIGPEDTIIKYRLFSRVGLVKATSPEERVNALFESAFNNPRDSRSDEYKEGVLAALHFRVLSQEIKNPYAQGTAAADAFSAGIAEGHLIWRIKLP